MFHPLIDCARNIERVTHRPSARIQGQNSFVLRSNTVQLAITETGGMLGPVTFFPDSSRPIQPYAIAPWAEEALPADTSTMIAALRGDWFCSAFGENTDAHAGHHLPAHGETANGSWRGIDHVETRAGSWLKLAIDLPLQGGYVESSTALVKDHSVVYQRHDLSRLTAPCNPGHHATLAFPPRAGAGNLSFSRLVHARTYFEPMERLAIRGASWLKPDVEITDLHAVPGIDGSTDDLARYPARTGFEDIAILCADPMLEFAWSAVTFSQEGYAWFALRDPKQLASTLLWFSNGGRHFPPWNGRHLNVMGIEDITAYFHVGIAASCAQNALSRRGIRTCIDPTDDGRLSIPYVQGVARVPAGFDRVASIERGTQHNRICLIAQSGVSVDVPCYVDFLRDAPLPGLDGL
jgi:hypothetical protein